jgi:hypothetical protein
MRYLRPVVGFAVGLLIAASVSLVTSSVPGFGWELMGIALGTFVAAFIARGYPLAIGLGIPIIIILAVQVMLIVMMRHAGVTPRPMTPTAAWMSAAMLADGLCMAKLGHLAQGQSRHRRQA